MANTHSWETKTPPHDELVEVEGIDGIMQVKAVHGGDGVFPHWTNESESIVWEHGSFDCWRHI